MLCHVSLFNVTKTLKQWETAAGLNTFLKIFKILPEHNYHILEGHFTLFCVF